MQEETLYEWWQYYARTGQLIETGHRRLRILAGGMLNTARGPDLNLTGLYIRVMWNVISDTLTGSSTGIISIKPIGWSFCM
jgi:hypothetical protein